MFGINLGILELYTLNNQFFFSLLRFIFDFLFLDKIPSGFYSHFLLKDQTLEVFGSLRGNMES